MLAGFGEPTILVDSLADDGSGGTTLREAVETANATPGADVIGFALTLAGGTIALTGGQLDLADEVTIQGLGDDQLTIDANQQGRVFFVAAGVTAELCDLTITGGRLENDDPLLSEDGGAAIVNLGDLTIRTSVLRGNFAEMNGGAVVNGNQTHPGTLSIINSLVTANEGSSGAVYNEHGDLTVVDSTFSFNRGRAIYNGAGDTVVVLDSTFVANINAETAFAGGAVLNEGQMDIVNSTFSGNLSWHHGGAIGNSGDLVITNSTLTANWADWVNSPLRDDWPNPRTSPWPAQGKGGGIYQGDSGSTTLYNTIVAENYVEPHRDDIAGTVNPASAHNLIGQSVTAGGLTHGVNGNLIGNQGSEAIEILTVLIDRNGDGILNSGDLADHGGPTQTFALAMNSPAIDAGANHLALDPDGNPLSTDQRGQPRQRNGDMIPEIRVDIGPYEAPSVYIVNTTDDTTDSDLGDGLPLDAEGRTSLRAAVEQANADGGVHFVAFDPALAGSAIILDSPLEIGASPVSGSLFGPTDLTIVGLGVNQLTIDGAGQTRLFTVLEDRRLSLSSLTLTGGSATESSGSNVGGGAIRNYGVVHIADARVANNTALEPNRTFGGAIFNEQDATLTIDDATFENNQAQFGGAIYNRGIVDIAGAAFLGNSTAGGAHGGAIYNRGDHSWQGQLTIADSRFEGNISGQAAGAIWSSHDSELEVQRSTFLGNQAAKNTGNGAGGAIYAVFDVDATIEASTFTDNRAESGGAIGVYADSTLQLSDSVFTGNVAERESGGYGNGGAIQLRGGVDSTVLNSTFRGNQAGEWGGAISNSGASSLSIRGSTFAENVARRHGGALEAVENGPTSIVNSTFVGNRTNGDGGAIFVSTDLTVAHTTIAGNRANAEGSGGGAGGGLFIARGHVTLSHTIIAGNYDGPDLEPDDIVRSQFQQNAGENHLTASYSLIGDAASAGGVQDRTLDPNNGNLVGDGGSGVIDITTVLFDGNDDGQIDADDLVEEEGTTPVVPLAEGSVASDAGDPGFDPDGFTPPLLVDQRGSARVIDERIDLGAVEFGSLSTFLVTSLADDGSGGLTLREAVAIANAQPGADVISFAPQLAGGTIVLTGGQLELTDDVVIQGLGADELIIDANQQGRAFLVHAGVTAELADLTITGGRFVYSFNPKDYPWWLSPPYQREGGGGAILNLGELTVRTSTLHGNYTNSNGGAIRNGDAAHLGTVSLINSQVGSNESRYGGGVFNSHGAISVTESTFRDNVGGAIIDGDTRAYYLDTSSTNLDTVRIVNSTFTGNTNVRDAGALGSRYGGVDIVNSTFTGNTGYFGGALALGEGRVDIVNSTFVGNSALVHGGAIKSWSRDLTIRNSTLVGNRAGTPNLIGRGGGIYQVPSTPAISSTTLYNTVVAGNFAGAGGDLRAEDITTDYGRPIMPESAYNLVGSAEKAGGLIDGVNGNLVGDGGSGVIDITGVLLDVNGDGQIDAGDLLEEQGSTPVLALTPGSVAIDAGDPGFDPYTFTPPLLADQRGIPRVINGSIDIGAVEFESNAMLLVTNVADDGAGLTLREAVEIANIQPGADVIGFAPELAGGTIVLTGGQLELTDGVVIQGLGADQLTIDANQQGRAFLVHAGVTAELADLTITGGKLEDDGDLFHADGGGAILNLGSLTIRTSVLHGNYTTTNGGAIRNGHGSHSGTLSVINSQISGNESELGGGVFNFHGAVRVMGSTLSDNAGGAIYNHVGNLVSIVDSTFSGNTNTRLFAGGALFNNHGRMDIINSTLTGNTSRLRGGAIGNSGELSIRNSTLVGNRARFGFTGGAIYQYYGERGDRDGDGLGDSGDGSGVDLGSTDLYNTIVAGNYIGTSSNIPDEISGPITSESAHNLVGSPNTAGGLTDGDNGNIVGNDGTGVIDIKAVLFDANGNARIDADDLMDYGRPAPAFALARGSIAIDAGDPNFDPNATTPPLDFDQRGAPRVMNERIDIGATEFDPSPNWRNSTAPPDVNDDAAVDVQDLLLVVQYVREHGVGYDLPDRPPVTALPTPYVDVNGDGMCSVSDLLSVVQAIRDNLASAAGEGEPAGASPLATSKPVVLPWAPPHDDPLGTEGTDDEEEAAERDAWLAAIAADVTAASGRLHRAIGEPTSARSRTHA